MSSSSRLVRSASCSYLLTAVLLAGCKTDCVYYPCPLFEAVEVAVSAAGSSGVPPGLALAVGNTTPQAGFCDALGVCRVLGSPGLYHLTITASGFTPRTIDVTVTGESAGCNTCGHVDRQQRSVVLQPAL